MSRSPQTSRLVPSPFSPIPLIHEDFDFGRGRKSLIRAAEQCAFAVAQAGFPFDPTFRYGCGAQGCAYPGTGRYRGEKYVVKFTVSSAEAMAAARLRDLARPTLAVFGAAPPMPSILARHYAAFRAPCSDPAEATVRAGKKTYRRRHVETPVYVIIREDVDRTFDDLVSDGLERTMDTLGQAAEALGSWRYDGQSDELEEEVFREVGNPHGWRWARVVTAFGDSKARLAAAHLREYRHWIKATGIRITDVDHNIGLRSNGSLVIYDVGFLFMPEEHYRASRKSIKTLMGL